MNITNLAIEGDINFSEERRKWEDQIDDSYTRELLNDDARYFLHQSMSTPCLDVLDSCSGSRIKTISGKHLLDFHGNNVHQVGHGNRYVISQILRQLNKLSFSPRRYTNRPSIELAKKLAGMLPGDINRSLFAPGGTLAIGMAIKLARVVTGNHKIIAHENSFHGASLDAISVGGEEIFRKHMGPLMPGVIHIPQPSTYRNIYGDSPEDFIYYADHLEDTIIKEGNIGAFIAETIRNTDVQIPSVTYWKKVRDICTRHKVLLILDEIPIALGRTGEMFAFEHFGIEPDILCLGKGLGGGIIPFAAMVTRDKYNIAQDISLGHYTHEKSPLGSVAALATIEFIQKKQLLEKVRSDGIWMKEELDRLKNRHPLIQDIRGMGLLWGIELVKDPATKSKAAAEAEKIMYQCFKYGLNFKVSGGNVIQLSPSLTINRKELTTALSILDDSLKEIK
jgi:4-aminobutyrate aminotransferase